MYLNGIKKEVVSLLRKEVVYLAEISNQVSGAIPIGFDFNFYCNSYNNAYVSSNGFVSFNPFVSSGCCSGGLIPFNDDVNNMIAWDWNDLYPPGGGSITYQTQGIAPFRKFIVNYSNIPHCCTSSPPLNSGQIILYETTNVIEIHTTEVTNDGSVHTQGIENANGTFALTVPGRNSTNWINTNDAYRFTPQSPVTYLWSNGQTTATAMGLTAGTYTCIITDANGCATTASYTITQPTVVTSTITSTNVPCKGSNTGSASVSASGGTPGFTYLWNTGAVTSGISNLYSGVYTCTVTDANGCTKTVSATITQPSILLTVSISKTNVRCGGKSTGSASALVSGGSSPYNYVWENSSTSDTRTNLAAGTYTVTVTDANGCSKTKSVTITQNTPLTAFAYPTGNPGEATVSYGGGVPAYSFVWNTVPQQTTQTANGLLLNVVYKVKVTDSKGCTATATVAINPCISCKEDDMGNAIEISAVPNPTDGLVSLVTSCSSCDYINVRIFNSVGEKLLDEKRSMQQLQFDLSSFTKGIYLFEVMVSDKRKTIKVVLE